MKFRQTYFIQVFAIILLLFMSCNEDDARDTSFLDGVALPSSIALNVQLTQDNTGVATLTPTGDSASSFTIDFGDGSSVVQTLPGEAVQHTYQEGTYSALITATNINGETATATQEVVVAFRSPENLMVTISEVAGDPFTYNFSATADFAVGFEVYFGDVPNETPTPLMVGETIQHTYADVGLYDVKFVALAGSAATIEQTVQLEINNDEPLVLPIDFESPTINYVFTDFGGATSTVIPNPDATGENTSATVGQFFKAAGAEVFAGSILELTETLNFDTFQGFSMTTWSPMVGAIVKLKIENALDGSISAEIDATTTVANQWETLFFDFSTADLTAEYSKVIVFFDFGNVGADTTYYFDNIAQNNSGGGGGGGVELPVDFEDASLMYTVFGFEGAESTIEANPDPTGINTSTTVVQTIKTVGAQFFAGTIVELDTAIDFSTTEIVKMKIYSPKANIPVRLKLENPDGSQFVELDTNTTTTDTWEELQWDFTGTTANNTYTKVVVFFEFDPTLPGDGSTYYFDDIELAN